MSNLLPGRTELHLRGRRLETRGEVAQRNRRVHKIMKVLGDVATKSEVQEAVIFHDTCYFDEERPGPYWIRTKKQKVAVKRLAVGLRRLKAVLNQQHLISTLRSDFPINQSDLEKLCRQV